MARRRRSGGRLQGIGALLVVAALILGLSYLPEARGVPVILGRWQRLFLGDLGILIPISLLLLGAALAIARERAALGRRIAAGIVTILTAAALAHWKVLPGDEIRAGLRGLHGGVAGGAILWALRSLLGRAGAGLLLGLGVLAAAILWTNLTLAAVLRGGWIGLTAGLRVLAKALILGTLWLLGAIQRVGAYTLSLLAAGAAQLPAAVTRVWMALLDVLPRRRATEAVPPPPAAVAPVALMPEVGPPALPVADAASPAVDGRLLAEDGAKAARARDGKPRHQQESLALEVPSGGFQLPPLTLLNDLPSIKNRGKADPIEVARLLEQTLASFGVEAKVVRWEQGPVVTRFEVQPAPGVRVQKISSLTNDIALALAAPSVRIEAPIPGKSAVGIELPNQKTALVHIKEILESEEYRRQTTLLAVALGKDIAGHPILGDLAEMPHVLIAGATGSGKSVMLNAIIAGLLFRCTPLDVRFLMIDPKRVEFTHFNNVPHLLAPVVTNPRAAAGALKEMLREMEERFERFAGAGVRNIQMYNQIPDGERLPFIVIIIDELADLMMVAPADFEDVICRLAQMTRATGIHMVLATQRPSVDVITGLIKANIPSRVAFAVSSQVDSRTILDMPGAEKLLGKGDMLYMPVGAARPVRAQGAFIADSEIQGLVTWWKSQGRPVYDQGVMQAEKTTGEGEGGEDALLAEAARLIVRAGYGSVSLLQRKMKIGYVRAARIVDQLEEKGIVGPAQGSNPREVLMGIDELEHLLKAAPAPR